MRPVVTGQALETLEGDRERDEAQGQVDPEDHRPVERLGDESAQDGTGQARRHEHAGEIDLVASPLLGRHEIGDDGLGQGDQPAAAESLEAARQDEHQHARRERAGHRAQDEDRDPDQHGDPPAMDVAELAVEGRHGRGGQEIGRHHPGQVLQIAEVPADGRQGRGDDGLVEGRQEHGQHEAQDDGADLRMAQGRAHVGREGLIHGHLSRGGHFLAPPTHVGHRCSFVPKVRSGGDMHGRESAPARRTCDIGDLPSPARWPYLSKMSYAGCHDGSLPFVPNPVP